MLNFAGHGRPVRACVAGILGSTFLWFSAHALAAEAEVEADEEVEQEVEELTEEVVENIMAPPSLVDLPSIVPVNAFTQPIAPPPPNAPPQDTPMTSTC